MARSHDQIAHDKGSVMNKKHKSVFIMMIAHMQPVISKICGGQTFGSWGKRDRLCCRMLGQTSPVLKWFYYQHYATLGVHYNINDYIMFQLVLKLWNPYVN